ncbi:IS110 family transposase [Streptomyces sp. NPDC001852]|uniref:IS110 family transposase n=1 Tax=Streptomyces sp. NPDC001852 TaxID=3364619 RepID=UPI0036801D6B
MSESCRGRRSGRSARSRTDGRDSHTHGWTDWTRQPRPRDTSTTRPLASRWTRQPRATAVDLNAGGGALLMALLTSHGQQLSTTLAEPSTTPLPVATGYRGDGKTDAKDAYVIADQARMRRDLQPLQEWDEIAVDLKILTARRYDLAADRTRAVNRMREQLLEYFPALERTFDYAASKAALILLTGYQTPADLRRVGPSRLATWLKNRKVRGAQAVADAAVAASQAQHIAVAGESTAAALVNTLARSVLALNEEIAAVRPMAIRAAPPSESA